MMTCTILTQVENVAGRLAIKNSFIMKATRMIVFLFPLLQSVQSVHVRWKLILYIYIYMKHSKAKKRNNKVTHYNHWGEYEEDCLYYINAIRLLIFQNNWV